MGSMTAAMNLTGMVINGLRVKQRGSLSASFAPRWDTECIKCGSQKTWDHQKLIHAMNGASGNVARCELTACRLGTFRKGEAPAALPNHTEDNKAEVKAAPVVVAAPKTKPVAVHPLWSDYQRAERARKQIGYEVLTFEQFKWLEEYKPAFFQTMMQEVNEWEQQQAQQAELERLGAEIEQQFNEDFNRRYNIAIVTNTRGRR